MATLQLYGSVLVILLLNLIISNASPNRKIKRETDSENSPSYDQNLLSASDSSSDYYFDPTNSSLRDFSATSDEIAAAFEKFGLIPDFVSTPPPQLLNVDYPSFSAQLGNLISPRQVLTKPKLSWPANPDAYYTLAMVGDEPRVLSPILTKKVQHWLVGNIPGQEVNKGQVLSKYIPSTPPAGPYRYVLVIYEQPGKLEFREPGIPYLATGNRLSFSIKDFAKKYNMTGPVAGNFYRASFPDIPVVSNLILKPILGGV